LEKMSVSSTTGGREAPEPLVVKSGFDVLVIGSLPFLSIEPGPNSRAFFSPSRAKFSRENARNVLIR